jgi:signal transduction histidine kinase
LDVPDALEEPLVLDSQALARLREARTKRMYTVTMPLLRAAGFVVLVAVTGIVASRFPSPDTWTQYRELVAINLAYVSVSWATVLLVAGAASQRRVGLAWLNADLVVWCFTVHFLERVSPYAALMLLVRVADQIGFGMRRTLWFMGVATLVYLVYGQIDATFGNPSGLAAADRLPVTAIFLGAGVYLAVTAGTIEAARRRQRAAMRAARTLVDELGQAKTRAEAANETKAALLANVSHELRTPIHGILGALDTLATAPLTPAQGVHLGAARLASLQLLSRVEDLLQVAPQGGVLRVPVRRIPFATAPWFAALDGAFGERARSKGLEWEMAIDPSVPEILVGDPLRLQQVVQHLLDNAVAFTTTGHVRMSCVFIDLNGHGPHLRLQIDDTGPGMPANQIETLVSPFERGDSSKTRRHGGLGLGLPQARAIVDELRGEMHIEGRTGGGTTVIVAVPVGRSAHSDPAVLERRARQRLVAVDDDPVNRLVLEAMLLREGFAVRVLESGPALLSCVESEGADLIFMDCHMPEMDGLEATRRLRKLAASQRVPVVGLTADTLPENELSCAEAGMTAVLFKPVSASVLAAAVHLWVT